MFPLWWRLIGSTMLAREQELGDGRNHADLLSIRNVSKYFRDKRGKLLTAVDCVNLELGHNQVIALVGESGSGKTTLGRLATGLVPASKGEINFGGQPISKYKRNDLWRSAQYIHQDPYSALDPYLTVEEVLERPLKYLAQIQDNRARSATVSSFIQYVGLENISPNTRIQRLSGGERQRVLVARSFILKPKFVVADEPTTMVDFIHRNEIIELLQRLRRENETSILFITHDLSLASYLADFVGIMYRGSIVEYGPASKILEEPLHPYTRALFSVTPDRLAEEGGSRIDFKRSDDEFGIAKESECKYIFACQFVHENCRKYRPLLKSTGSGHEVACFLHVPPE